MSEYRRLFINGGTYFFTIVTHNRRPFLCDHLALDRLKMAFIYVKNKYPYAMKGLVVLPDHLHCIWQLPENDSNFSMRWNLFKRYFSIGMESPINKRREKLIWQRRFWERLIRDEEDLHRYLDYIHFNPVKHGYVQNAKDWENSTFKQYVKRGFYDINWGCNESVNLFKIRLNE